MHKLDSYIARQVLLAMVLVLLALGGLDLLFSAVDELGDTNERYGTSDALQYLLLTFPRHLYELLPMSALIGALAGLGALASGNELVVMQSAGVSNSRIILAVMKPALLVMIVGLILGEYVAPALEIKAEVNKSSANGEQVGLSRFGHWERDGDAFIHFNTIEPDGILYGVSMLVYDEQHRVVRSVDAERAVYVPATTTVAAENQSGLVHRARQATLSEQAQETAEANTGSATAQAFWLLENGREITFSYSPAASTDSQVRRFTAQHWDLDLTPDLLQVLIIDPDQMAMTDLYTYARRFQRQGQDAAPYYLSFWKKTLQPLTTAVLVLVAISFIFGPLREASMGSRVFTAICFGLVFTIVQKLLHTLGLIFQFPALLAVLLPLLLTAIPGWLMFRRAA